PASLARWAGRGLDQRSSETMDDVSQPAAPVNAEARSAWKSIAKDKFDRTLEWVTPQRSEVWGFLGGDPWITDPETLELTYTCCIAIDGKYYEHVAPMTAAQFDNLTRERVAADIQQAQRLDSDPTRLISSSVVSGFHNVSVATGMTFPCCARQITP